MRRKRNLKGYLLFAMFFALFVFVFEVCTVAVLETAYFRINSVKNRITADSLARSGIEYYKGIGGPFKDVESLKELNLPLNYGTRTENYRVKTFCAYSSPAIARNGYFILRFYYDGNRITEVESVGISNGAQVMHRYREDEK